MSKNDFKMEYRIVTQKGRAKPYSLWTFNTYEACYLKLMELIQQHNSMVQKEYYVTNENFENEYPAFLADITKYTIQCRSVEEYIKIKAMYWCLEKVYNLLENREKSKKSYKDFVI